MFCCPSCAYNVALPCLLFFGGTKYHAALSATFLGGLFWPPFSPENNSAARTVFGRYYLVQRAREAGVIGIVVGTLGVQRYGSVVRSLRKMIEDAGRKAYTLAVGKVNVAKLANFAEVGLVVALYRIPRTSITYTVFSGCIVCFIRYTAFRGYRSRAFVFTHRAPSPPLPPRPQHSRD